ncbi:replication-associated recombination protein A [uncultured Victivallis sp.]|uniref:replication-associated recombination protein A n=1 Tax=uncultured Victivallis sp. TaxID=354118 RepID=UPI0025CE2ECA|nr:replication-associated recombination protein A [uncultured Victivallis sp.]
MRENLFELEPEFPASFTGGTETEVENGSGMPLAARLRPRSLDEYVGQRHLLEPGRLLRRAIGADRFSSIILSGPPGTGKTSLAEVIARMTDSEFIRLSGVTSSVADVRREIAAAVKRRRSSGRRTILFIDEIHRFSRSQQDSLLPDVENGNVRLIGATTHNPHFYVVGALLSRSLVFRLEPLSQEEIRTLLHRAADDERSFPGRKVELEPQAADFLATACEGDARRALNALEVAALTTDPDDAGVTRVTLTEAEASIQQKMIVYGDDGHYDTASAFIKSMRGSDPDAAVYYLAKMLHAGEDIRFIARRLTIFAAEDVGNADPRALELCTAAMQAVEMIGLPEAKLILAQATTYCATAPKSNASYAALEAAATDVEQERVQPIPVRLRDAHYAGAKAEGIGKDYLYPHDYPGGFVPQEYLSVDKRYYEPKEIGYEARIRERVDYWRALRDFVREEKRDGKA